MSYRNVQSSSQDEEMENTLYYSVVEESSSSDDDSIFQPRTLKVRGRARKNVIQSDSEEEVESLLLSPRTRMSITGVRPRDMNSSESSDFSDSGSQINESAEKSEVHHQSSSPLSSSSRDNNDTVDQKSEVYEQSPSSSSRDNDSPDQNSELLQQSQSASPSSGDEFNNSIANKLSSTRYQSHMVRQYVSQEFYDREAKELHNFVSKLADKTKQLAVLKNNIRKKAELLSSYIIEEDKKINRSGENNPAIFNPKVPDCDDLAAAVNHPNNPKHTGRIGRSTFNNQKALTVERLNDIHGSLEICPTEDVLVDDPRGLKITLMDHQKHALAWMNWREKQRPRGGILADDKGLGKTITMISLILDSKNDSGDSDNSQNGSVQETQGCSSNGGGDLVDGGTLVVCPVSLLQQWQAELENRVKRYEVTTCVHYDTKRDILPTNLCLKDIVVTTYRIVSDELKSKGVLFAIKWKRIILDEAQVIRNHKCKLSMAVFALNGRFRWALTSTPIQNKEMETYAVLKFLKCTPFDDLQHWKKWIDNKNAGGQQRLNKLMKSLMLRRTKVQLQEKGALLGLPTKEISLIEVELDNDERNVYQKLTIFSKTLVAQFLHQKNPKASMMYGGKDIQSQEITVLLLRLRQICCHPGLINSMLEDEADRTHLDSTGEDSHHGIDLLEQLEKLGLDDRNDTSSALSESVENSANAAMSMASAKVLLRTDPVFNLSRPSTKIQKIMQVFEEKVMKTSDKAVIVSQWASVLNILKTQFAEKRIGTLLLDGRVAVKNRHDIVDEFNSPHSKPKVLLLSLTASGVDLNLIGANHLFLIDLHWNPQLESLAQDRIYRVGQKKPVHIYKFMCKDTVEERIKALQNKKLKIASGVLTRSMSSEGSKLSIEDLKGLFGL